MDIKEKIESYLSEAKKEKKTEKKEEKKSSPKKKEAKSDDKIYTYTEWAKMAKEQGYVIREIKPGVFQADDGKGNTLKYDSKKVKNSLSEASETKHSLSQEQINAIKNLINWIPGDVHTCHGDKCREPWCTSCNDEDDAHAAIKQARDAVKQAKIVFKI